MIYYIITACLSFVSGDHFEYTVGAQCFPDGYKIMSKNEDSCMIRRKMGGYDFGKQYTVRYKCFKLKTPATQVPRVQK